MLELTETLKACLWQTAKTLKGPQLRRFMAQIVQELGTGGQRKAQTELGWCRDTIRKGQRELETGLSCIDAFNARGRKPVESKLPQLSEDIKAIVDSLASDRPQFQKHSFVHASECGKSKATTGRAFITTRKLNSPATKPSVSG